MKAKGTLILGVILFVFGLLTFFLLVPSVGPLRKLIENDNISLPIGISAFIICIIIGLILIAINENEEVNNYRKEKYKIKLYQEFIASIILGVFAIIGIVIGVFLDDFKILLISLAILIVSFGVFIYYQQKNKEIITIINMYLDEKFEPASFYELILNDYFKDRLVNKLETYFMDSEIVSKFDEREKEVTIIFIFKYFEIEIVIDENEFVYYINLDFELENEIYDQTDLNQIADYNEKKLDELLYSYETFKIHFSKNEIENSYKEFTYFVNGLISKINELIEILKNIKKY